MRTASYYHKGTGILKSHIISADTDEGIVINTPADHLPFFHAEMVPDHLSQRVDVTTGQLVDYQPPSPSDDHEWSPGTKRWSIKAAIQAKADTVGAALRQIALLEASQATPMRELALGKPGALEKLKEIDAAIQELRKIISTL